MRRSPPAGAAGIVPFYSPRTKLRVPHRGLLLGQLHHPARAIRRRCYPLGSEEPPIETFHIIEPSPRYHQAIDDAYLQTGRRLGSRDASNRPDQALMPPIPVPQRYPQTRTK